MLTVVAHVIVVSNLPHIRNVSFFLENVHVVMDTSALKSVHKKKFKCGLAAEDFEFLCWSTHIRRVTNAK